jgi:pSer/pThr/pTyr-binding forkhead associated (FHA) protein
MAIPKLIILSEVSRGQTYELTDEHYTIGRVEAAEICVPDATVSSNHCALVSNGDGTYRAVDQGSTNGTRINGVRITEQDMVNSDILQVGEVEIMYDCEDQSLTSVLSTQTGIDLHDTAGGVQVNEMENLNRFKKGGSSHSGESAKARVIFIAVISVLVLVVLVLAGVFLKKFIGM